MTTLGIFPNPKTSADEIIAATKHFSDATTEQVIKRLHEKGHNNERTKLIIATILTGDENVTSELIALEKYCEEDKAAPYDHNLHHLIAIIRGLHEYEEYKDTPLDLTTEAELDKIITLLNITSLLLRDYKNPPLIIENIDDYKTSKVWLTPEATNLVVKYQEDFPYLMHFLSMGNSSILEGLKYLNWWKKQSISAINDKTIDTLFSYLYVTDTIREHAFAEITSVGEYAIEAEHINNPELEAFIEDNPAELDDFMLYIEERGTSDVGAFQEWKTNGTSLRNGGTMKTQTRPHGGIF